MPQSWYLRDDVVDIAQSLLGHYLCSYVDDHLCVGRIVETEAYKAPEDKASHAYQNRRTDRTEVMFLEGGISYIYLCYGMHYMFNVVTGKAETAHAILVRSLEPVKGVDVMHERRKSQPLLQLTNGPGKLCQAMGLTKEQNGLKLFEGRVNPVWISPGTQVGSGNIIKSERIGVDYSEEWRSMPWRFYDRNSSFVSAL